MRFSRIDQIVLFGTATAASIVMALVLALAQT